MTYCVAIRLDSGMIFASDTRTNAGIDQISTFRKLYQFGVEGERFLVLQTAGNLGTSQAVFTKLQQDIQQGILPNLHSVATLFDAAQLVGEYVRKVSNDAKTLAADNKNFTSSFILGGQIKGQALELYRIYPEGNCIHATQDTPYFQLGEIKYGKPILDRSLTYYSPMREALRATLISFDSTMHSNLSVGMPLDIVTYKKDAFNLPTGKRIESSDAYFGTIRTLWSEGLKSILNSLPLSPDNYWQ